MNIYDSEGKTIISPFSEINFYLTIDYENLSHKDLTEVVSLLRNSSSYCNEDIIQISRVIIDELEFINYNIIREEYKEFVNLVHSIFRALNSIKNKTELMIIYNNFNKYIKGRNLNSNPSSPVSPPSVKN